MIKQSNKCHTFGMQFVGFDIKEDVIYTDFTSCLCVCLDVCLCYQGLRFLCYVSSDMFPVICFLFD